mmetsp:Transcript_32311/g.93054  ORF Transcript_32311/g.93054 Transcript_32311/m.93054 type:complete len:208 (-) Transcript_32311:282-905(-)
MTFRQSICCCSTSQGRMVRTREASHSASSNHSRPCGSRFNPSRQTWVSPWTPSSISSRMALKSARSTASPSVSTRMSRVPHGRPSSCRTWRRASLTDACPEGGWPKSSPAAPAVRSEPARRSCGWRPRTPKSRSHCSRASCAKAQRDDEAPKGQLAKSCALFGAKARSAKTLVMRLCVQPPPGESFDPNMDAPMELESSRMMWTLMS